MVSQPAGVFTMTGTSTIAYNDCARGGGLFVNNGNVTLSGGQILSNSADLSGGGVYVSYGSATLSGGQILSNTASNGGGVYIERATAVLTQTAGIIAYNSGGSGGGIYILNGNAVLSGGQILSNTAASGGGMFVSDGAISLDGGQILSNRAINGGGVYLDFASATLSGVQVSGNYAHLNGGGIMLFSASSVYTQTGATSITQNSAGQDGGGVYIRDGTAMLSGGTFLDNSAVTNGDGVYNAGTISQTAAITISDEYYQSGGEFEAGSQPVTFDGVVSLPSGVFTATSGLMTVTGDFAYSGGTFAHNGGSVEFAGDGLQSLTANAAITFNNVTVITDTTLVETVAADNVSLDGILVNDGTIRKSKSSLGTGSTSFGITGATIDVSTLGFLSSLQVDRVGSAHADENSAGRGADMLDTYFALTPNGGADGTFSAELCLSYTDGELSAAPAVSDEGSLRLCRWTGSAWACPDRGASSSTTNNTVCASGVSTFSDWTMGEVGITIVSLKHFGTGLLGNTSYLTTLLAFVALAAVSAVLLRQERRRK